MFPADGERWLGVPGWPGYQVSDLAQVRSVPRKLADGRAAGGVLLKQVPDGKGYMRVTLRDGKRRRTVRVHVLVAQAHIGPRPDGEHVRHRDDDKSRNQRDNLLYGPPVLNERDKRGNQQKRKDRINRSIRQGPSRALSVVDLGIPRSEGE